jgi:ferrous iron transport protein A
MHRSRVAGVAFPPPRPQRRFFFVVASGVATPAPSPPAQTRGADAQTPRRETPEEPHARAAPRPPARRGAGEQGLPENVLPDRLLKVIFNLQSSGTLPNLASVELGVAVRVVSLEIEAELGAYLRALGIAEGERITVLRRAALGGPLHIRTEHGGEFAVNRSLAAAVRITCEGARPIEPSMGASTGASDASEQRAAGNAVVVGSVGPATEGAG